MTQTLVMPTMGKKNSARRHYASELRTGHPSPAELRKAADLLQGYAGRLLDLAERLEEADLKSVEIDGARKFPNGAALIDTYIKAVATGLIRAQ